VTATEETTTDDRIVLRDGFPSLVAVDGDPTYRSASVVITRDRILVYLTRAAPILDAPYDPATSIVPRYNAPRQQQAVVRLLSGQTLAVTRQRGCGCSNPLKGWRPWRPYRVAA
jgi:hypothetical protein